MKTRAWTGLWLLAASGAVFGHAQDTAGRPAYLDPDLAFEARAADLVSRLTVEEKVSQLMNDAPAIPRLGIPAYEWWNECLHGVARAGAATVFPQAIGMAASFDKALMRKVATAISDEARAKHHEFARRGQRARYQGLTFWSPNINIFRDPRWGRGQETYGEDPYLTARMGVEFVKGLQGDDPRYLKVVATAKHYAVHSGPEKERHVFDARPSESDLYETYLPAFQALVQEGHVASVMGAYNRVNGESASASQRLLQDILRRDWGFDGYVVSDCGAIDDIHKTHKIVATPADAAALGVTRGCDLECGSVYKSLKTAVDKGLIAERDIDVAVKRLMLARLRLGLFDPPEKVRYAQIPYSVNQSAEHDRLARRMAQESVVLLKNDGLLPLAREKKVAVIGPNADEVMTLLGNYYGTPAKPVTVLAGIRDAVAPAPVLYARGADLVEGRQDPRAIPAIDAAYLAAEGGAGGLKGEYFRGRELEGTPMLTRVDPRVDFRWARGPPTNDLVARGELPADRALANDDFSVRWTGQLVPPVSGRYELTVTGDDGFRLDVDGKRVIDEWTTTPRARARSAPLDLDRRGPRRGDSSGLEAARRQGAAGRGTGRRARRRRRGLRGRPHRRRRGRGDDGVVPRILGWGPHGPRPPFHPGQAAASSAGDGQADRPRPDDRIRDRRGVGAEEHPGHRGGLVPRTAGRQCRGRRPLRRRQSRGPAAGDVLQVRRRAPPLRRLRHEGTDVSLLPGRPALSFRPWALLHALRILGPARRPSARGRAGNGERVRPREERRGESR